MAGQARGCRCLVIDKQRHDKSEEEVSSLEVSGEDGKQWELTK